jgi:hypothetical protein
MRLDPKQVRFVTPLVSSSRRVNRLRLIGRQNSVQLLETALVVEGYILKLTFLFGIETLFTRTLSEWTTITVPYSRIRRADYSGMWLVRFACFLPTLVYLAVLATFAWAELDFSRLWTEPTNWLVTVTLVIFGLLLNWLVKSRYLIEYLARDGRRTRFAFKIRSRRLRGQFDAALQRYRQSASGHASRA